jgi:hypothetical protein
VTRTGVDILAGWSIRPTGLGALLLLALAVVPGLTWVRCRPSRGGEQRHPAALVAAGTAVGFSVWVLSASLLVRLGWLRTIPVWTVALGIATACAAVLVARRRSATSERRGVRPERGRALGMALPFVAAVTVGLPQLVTILHRPESLVSPTAWYYWLTAQSVAAAGGVPDLAHEWGETTPAFTFHFGFSASTAILSVAGGAPDSLVPAQIVRIVTVLVFGLGVWCLAKALGASDVTAVAGVALASFAQIYAIKLSSLRPEALAYGFGCLAVALLVWGLRARDRWLLASSAVAAVGVSQVHGLTALLVAAMMTGVAAAYLVGWLEAAGSTRGRLVVLGLYAGVTAVGAVVAGFAMTGKWSEATAAGGLPALGEDGDPTWAFARLVSGQAVVEPAGAGAPTTPEMARESLAASFIGSGGVWMLALCALCLVLFLLAPRTSRRDAAAVLLFGVASVAALLVIAYGLSLLGATYVPRRTGFSRVLQLWPLVLAVAVAALAGLVRAGAWRLLTTGLLIAVTVVVAVRAVPRIGELGRGQPTRAQLEQVAALPIDEGSTVLTNAFTQGFVTLWTPGRGLLDGHAPYLERDLLARSSQILRDARAYFRAPRRSPFPFDEYDVDYVLAAKRPHVLGTPATFPGNLDRLAGQPRLELLAESADLVLYEVVEAGNEGVGG